jgi:uncharacterized membrane protein
MINFIYELLATIGFKHPLHPAITHIPMGMIMGGFFFALVSLFKKNESLATAAHYCFTLALIFVLPTMIAGFMDWQYKFDAEWSGIILTKLILAFVLVALLIVTFLQGRKPEADIRRLVILYAVCFVTAIGLGFMGAELQYG